MTSWEINIALATVFIQGFNANNIYLGLCNKWLYYLEGNECEVFPIPDYVNDLNVIHEVEKTLNTQQHGEYRETLAKVVGFTCDVSFDGARAYISSSARQRAEALLKALGKWME